VNFAAEALSNWCSRWGCSPCGRSPPTVRSPAAIVAYWRVRSKPRRGWVS